MRRERERERERGRGNRNWSWNVRSTNDLYIYKDIKNRLRKIINLWLIRRRDLIN